MVQIIGGTFLMGSPENEEGRFRIESPQHQVTISTFYMGKYEVNPTGAIRGTERVYRGGSCLFE
jgi:hypothetical protein